LCCGPARACLLLLSLNPNQGALRKDANMR
jgi:hypothetical protein